MKLTISGSNFGLPNSSAVSIEFECGDTSQYCVKGKKIILNNNNPFWKNNHSTIETVMPEGVGKDLVIKICAAGQCYSLPQTFSFADPKITSLTPNAGLTDGCKDGAWEPLSVWHSRVDGASPAQIKRTPQLQRRCNQWTQVKIIGENFGPFPEAIKVTVGTCTDYKTEKVCTSLVGKGKCQWTNDKCKTNTDVEDDSAFTLFDGTMYPLDGTGPVPRRLTSGVDDNIDAENSIIDRKRLTQALINLHQYVSRQNGRRLALLVV